MPQLMHCIYASAASHDFQLHQLRDILASSRRNNNRQGVTGVMLYAQGSFFQVLEGEQEVVDALFEKIAQDPRHTKVTQIIFEAIPRRTFADWSMGFSDFSTDELRDLAGVTAFVSWQSSVLNVISSSRARMLLNAFCEGRWRMRSAEPNKLVTA